MNECLWFKLIKLAVVCFKSRFKTIHSHSQQSVSLFVARYRDRLHTHRCCVKMALVIIWDAKQHRMH